MKYLLLPVFLSQLCSNQDEVVLNPEPVVPAPLPEMCKPWRPGPKWEEIPAAEVKPPIQGENLDRMFCSSNGITSECQTFGDLNSYWFQSEYLWLKDENGHRVPNGGGGDCGGGKPWTRDVLECRAEIRNQEWAIVEIVDYTCRGDRFCGQDKAAECCKVTKRTKVNIPYDEPSKEQVAKWDQERCDRLAERHRVCKPFCTDTRYKGECADYWLNTCGS